jgi:hypothetical protein
MRHVPQFSSNATVPNPPSAQMLTMARLPCGIAASSFTAWLRMRAPVAANGWPSARFRLWPLFEEARAQEARAPPQDEARRLW